MKMGWADGRSGLGYPIPTSILHRYMVVTQSSLILIRIRHQFSSSKRMGMKLVMRPGLGMSLERIPWTDYSVRIKLARWLKSRR